MRIEQGCSKKLVENIHMIRILARKKKKQGEKENYLNPLCKFWSTSHDVIVGARE
jgi:hypothetical protein